MVGADILATGGLIATEEYDGSYAFRAARLRNTRGFRVAHDPGSRGDFIQALQLLGTNPEVRRLLASRTPCLTVPVHLSCSRANWTEVFGEPGRIEEGGAAKDSLYLWKHSCTDGPITCLGYLFEQRPGEGWVVVVRISLF